MSAAQKPALALWAPGSPQVHVQGNLSTGFQEKGNLPGKDAPRSHLPGLGPAPHTLDPIPSHHRAGLDEGNVQTYLAGGSSQPPLRHLRLSSHPGGKLYQQVCVERSLESHTWVPSGSREPCCSYSLGPGTVTNMVPEASFQGQLNGIVGVRSCAFVHRACIPSSQRLFLPAGAGDPRTSWLLGAGMQRDQLGPADRRTAHLCSASWAAGAGQAEDAQPQSSLPFFGCFSNLQDTFFPRLIDQSQGARILKCPVPQNCPLATDGTLSTLS